MESLNLKFTWIEHVCNTTETCQSSNCVHCHIIISDHVSIAIGNWKIDKVNDNILIYSNNFILGTKLLFQYFGTNTTSMVYHGYCPPLFVCANVIPISKGSKTNLSDSDKCRWIANSFLLGKIFDHITIEKQSKSLTTSN